MGRRTPRLLATGGGEPAVRDARGDAALQPPGAGRLHRLARRRGWRLPQRGGDLRALPEELPGRMGRSSPAGFVRYRRLLQHHVHVADAGLRLRALPVDLPGARVRPRHGGVRRDQPPCLPGLRPVAGELRRLPRRHRADQGTGLQSGLDAQADLPPLRGVLGHPEAGGQRGHLHGRRLRGCLRRRCHGLRRARHHQRAVYRLQGDRAAIRELLYRG